MLSFCFGLFLHHHRILRLNEVNTHIAYPFQRKVYSVLDQIVCGCWCGYGCTCVCVCVVYASCLWSFSFVHFTSIQCCVFCYELYCRRRREWDIRLLRHSVVAFCVRARIDKLHIYCNTTKWRLNRARIRPSARLQGTYYTRHTFHSNIVCSIRNVCLLLRIGYDALVDCLPARFVYHIYHMRAMPCFGYESAKMKSRKERKYFMFNELRLRYNQN